MLFDDTRQAADVTLDVEPGQRDGLGVPKPMQIDRLARTRVDPHGVPAAVRFAPDVQRLMQIDHEVNEKPERVAALFAGRPGVLKFLGKMGDGPENVAFRRMPVAFQRHAVGNIHVVPGRRMLPLRFPANPVRPQPDFIEPAALPEHPDLGSRGGAKALRRHEACDPVPVHTEPVRTAGCHRGRHQQDGAAMASGAPNALSIDR